MSEVSIGGWEAVGGRVELTVPRPMEGMTFPLLRVKDFVAMVDFVAKALVALCKVEERMMGDEKREERGLWPILRTL